MIFPYSNINIFNTHDILLDVFHYFKNNFLKTFLISVHVFPMLPYHPWFKIYTKCKIFSTLVLTMSLIYFLVFSNIISNTINPQHFSAFYFSKINWIMFNFGVFNVFFLTPLLLFVVILFASICPHPWCHLNMFLLLKKFKSFSN